MVSYFNEPTNNDMWAVDLLRERSGGYFIEAGALDGIGGSCTYALAKFFGWKGLLVEPGSAFAALKINRPEAFCANVCVSDEIRNDVFINSEVQGYSGLRSALEAEEEKHLRRYGKRKDEWRQGKFEEIEVNVTTFEQLLEECRAPEVIDYMALDMEGSELQALSRFPFDRYKVDCISIEGDSCSDFLTGQGFVEVRNPFNDSAPWEHYFVSAKMYPNLASKYIL